MSTYYMHTMDGKPAWFDGEMIYFQSHKAIPLCVSLRQIRREQQASIRNRLAEGLSNDFRHGYVRVSTGANQ